MRIDFIGEPENVSHEEAVGWEAMVDGRSLRCRFTRDAIRSVMPLPADKGDLRARVASHREIFAALVAKKLAGSAGEMPTKLVITAADVPEGT